MAPQLTRPWANRVEMCVLCGQSSFTSAQHIYMWEVKRNETVLHFEWDSSLLEERKDAHAHLLAFHNIFIFVLNCNMILFICISLCRRMCLFCISASEKKIGRALHAVCGRVCLCVCVCQWECVNMCDASVFLLGYFPGWLIWFDIGGFVLCEQSAWGRIGFVMRKWYGSAL